MTEKMHVEISPQLDFVMKACTECKPDGLFIPSVFFPESALKEETEHCSSSK